MQQAQDIQFPVIDALIAFAKDHFSHFGCLPAEFEYEGDVLDFDTYMNLLSEDDIQAITNQAPANETPYPLPEKMGLCGESFRMWKFANSYFVPTYHQLRLYQAVYQAVIEHELFYNTEVYEFVVNALSDILTPELLARNSATMPTERGHFGMEIYYMRDVVNEHNINALNRDALSEIMAKGIRVGSVIKGPFKRGLDTYSSMEVTGIDRLNGTLALVCKKRGSRNKWAINIGAMCNKLQDCIS